MMGVLTEVTYPDEHRNVTLYHLAEGREETACNWGLGEPTLRTQFNK